MSFIGEVNIRMKKVISVLLMTVILFCFCSCENAPKNDNSLPSDITDSDVAIAVVDYLSKLPNGSKTSISKSISAIYGKDFASTTSLDLLYIHSTVFELAEEHGIILEPVLPEGTLTGMPGNTFFTVRKK